MIVWHKSLTTYREGDAVYIEANTRHPDMVGQWEVGDIVFQSDITNGVAKLK